jgi:competence protein ComEC
MLRRVFKVALLSLCMASALMAQANGKLQLHFMDVGQGDGAVLISPQGTVVLFDAGEDLKRKDCTKPLAYLDQLGVTKVDYLFVSHYHFDHIGCIPQVLERFPLQHDAIDRGAQYPAVSYTSYVQAVGGHRKTGQENQVLQLDGSSGHPVTITVAALNGAGIATSNENDLSLTATITFDRFRAEIGGDLSGDDTGQYKDIETTVAANVGHVDVYKVHHHCSSHSTNEAWLRQTTPVVGIVSAGDGNDYGHPAPDCLERLHKAGVKLFWTEHGNGGVDPEPGLDLVGGNIVVQADPGATTFAVTANGGQTQTFAIGGGAAPPAGAPAPQPSPLPTYAWSVRSHVYHYANCDYVKSISPDNLQTGSTPPTGKTLHRNCPTTKQQ